MKPIYLAAFLLAACAAGPAGSGSPAPENTPPAPGLHGEWKIIRIGNAPAAEGTLTFDANQRRFFADFGCNHLSGGFTPQGSSVKMSDVISTMMYCSDQKQQLENRFATTMPKAAAYRINGNTLELLDSRQQSILSATRR